MIKTNDLLMARLQWPPPPEECSPKEVRHWKKILAAGRRCLHEQAPVTLHNTGFQLLRKTVEPEMRACLEATLDEIELTTADILVLLPAPVSDEYSQEIYEKTLSNQLIEISEEVIIVSAKLVDKEPRVDTFNKAFRMMETLSGYVNSDELRKCHSLLVKLEEFDYEEDNAKGVRLLRKLAVKISECEL